ncbi:MAG: response regulator transcription factor [Ignavibacteriales bacterium]|nr:response regulator transcription factor [Ignavibacteriales bacterium]
MKILVVEDELDLKNSILTFIKQDGFLCEGVSKYEHALEKVNLYEFDCFIIDITLPDGNGLDLINKIKQIQPQAGIIIISAKNSLEDKITGLDLGADDYLTKPFHLAELNSRINSVLRRRFYQGKDEIKLNEMMILPDRHELLIKENKIDLTKREFDLLMYLVTNKEKVITKEAIAEHIWGDDSNSFDNFDFIYTHIKNLRKKISDYGGGDYIKSIYGLGYKFTLE